MRSGSLICEPVHIRHIGDQNRRFRGFAQCADDFIVIAMADQHDRIALFGESNGLQMNFGDQRTGGVNHL